MEQPPSPGPIYRLVLAGDAGAGKSSFLLRLCTNEFRGDIPTTLGTGGRARQGLQSGAGHGRPVTISPARGGLPHEAAAGGRGAHHAADLGHGRPGEVCVRGAPQHHHEHVSVGAAGLDRAAGEEALPGPSGCVCPPGSAASPPPTSARPTACCSCTMSPPRAASSTSASGSTTSRYRGTGWGYP